MLKISYFVLPFVALAACNTNNDSRSDFVAYQNSYVNKINLLKDDKELGIKRNLKKITEETVNSDENLHKKIVTINETLEMNTAKGDATAVLVFDSANKQRSGKRSIVLSDDGTAFLGEFVKQFETSKYKNIPNDKFENIDGNTNSIKQVNKNKELNNNIDNLPQKPYEQKEVDLIEKLKKIDNVDNVIVSPSLNTDKKINEDVKIKSVVKPVITMKPVAEKTVSVKKSFEQSQSQIDQIVTNNENIAQSPKVLKNNVINSVVLKPLETKEVQPETHNKPKPLHVWL